MALKIFGLRSIRISFKRFDLGVYKNYVSTSRTLDDNRLKEVFKTGSNLKNAEDPDTFGTLSNKFNSKCNDILQDEGDIKEQEYLEKIPLPTQKLTIRQYADLIKQYLKHKRLKEAIDILEVRMLTEDRVKPENYIYNILIGACADVGYTKKAFKLYNDMKRRALKPTGDTYTCLFEACINSPWPADGLKNAKHLRELMIEKGIEPNLTNYNVMIKAFGRCGDLSMAFKIVDEMVSKKIKIRVHTFNHLLHACISDKEHGLRHALLVWRKMLTMKEKPNIYSFNLMLKCVKDCNLGSKEDIQTLIEVIQDQIMRHSGRVNRLQIESNECVKSIGSHTSNGHNIDEYSTVQNCDASMETDKEMGLEGQNYVPSNVTSKEITIAQNQNSITLIPKEYKIIQRENRTVPNLLSKFLQLNQVLSLQEVKTLQDKFAIIGGQEDFLKEMEAMFVKPDIKTFIQMLPLIEENRECEIKIIEKMKSLNIKPDIDFYNTLIKKRCLRMDYDGAFLIKELIEDELKKCKKSYQRRKAAKSNIMTFGVLALACKTKEDAVKLLNEMKEKQLKVNIVILGTLLRHGTAHMKFGYVMYIMDVVKQENLNPNEVFLKHLEAFHDKCISIVNKNETNNQLSTSCKTFLSKYKTWLKDVHIEEEHPWQQFMEPHPETVQRENIEIKEPKKFYKRNRQFIHYAPRV